MYDGRIIGGRDTIGFGERGLLIFVVMFFFRVTSVLFLHFFVGSGILFWEWMVMLEHEFTPIK